MTFNEFCKLPLADKIAKVNELAALLDIDLDTYRGIKGTLALFTEDSEIEIDDLEANGLFAVFTERLERIQKLAKREPVQGTFLDQLDADLAKEYATDHSDDLWAEFFGDDVCLF